MSEHTDRNMPSREELVAATARPMPRSFVLVSAIFAIIGILVFIIGAFKGGTEDTGFLPIADYYHDFRMWAYTQTGDHDCRDVLTGSYWVQQTGPTTYAALSPADEAALFVNADNENVPVDKAVDYVVNAVRSR